MLVTRSGQTAFVFYPSAPLKEIPYYCKLNVTDFFKQLLPKENLRKEYRVIEEYAGTLGVKVSPLT